MMSKELWTDERINAMKTPDARSVALKMRHEYEQRIAELEASRADFATELHRQTLLAAYRQQRIQELFSENQQLRATIKDLQAVGKCMCQCHACKYCEQLLEDTP